MKLTTNKLAPRFRTNDVFGTPFDLHAAARSGQKMLLSFFRSAGCPVCNTRVAQLMGNVPRWQERGLIVVAVYESSRENLLGYVQDATERRRFPFTIIADPERRFYETFGVESSFSKMMGGFMKGSVISMAKNGSSFEGAFAKPKQDGSMTRIGADFLIDERGFVHTAHYGSHLGDHLPVEAVSRFAAQQHSAIQVGA
ncbi:MAG: redoxin domain-containing protein [Candidatus Kapaibacteriota bacterium]|jgi:peroxiredoxin